MPPPYKYVIYAYCDRAGSREDAADGTAGTALSPSCPFHRVLFAHKIQASEALA